jgi:hypothetical protein
VQASLSSRGLRHGFFGTIGTQDLLEQTARQTFHSSHLMNERKLQPPVPAFIYSSERQYWDQIRWRPGIVLIPSVTELGAFGILYTAPFFPQVTTACDHVLIPKALSVFRGSGLRNVKCRGALITRTPKYQHGVDACCTSFRWTAQIVCVIIKGVVPLYGLA